MANVVVCRVRDLGVQTREWVANMFGRPLAEDEQVTVMVFPPGQAPSPSQGQAAWGRIKDILNRAEENMSNVPEEEVEAAIDEAMAHVRPR